MGSFVRLSDHKIGGSMGVRVLGLCLGLLFFKIALKFEFWIRFGFVNDDFCNKRIIIGFSMFVGSINDLF